MYSALIGFLMVPLAASVADQYDRYFDQLDASRNVLLAIAGGTAVPGGKTESDQIAHVVLGPMRQALQRDIHRIIAESVGALSADIALDDVNRDGVVSGMDAVVLRDRIWARVVRFAPRARRELLGMSNPAPHPADTVLTSGSPQVITSVAALLADPDGDGVPLAQDNCPAKWNADQANQDGDPTGDACDDDTDGDGVPNGADQCPARGAGVGDADADGCEDSACLLVVAMERMPIANAGIRNSLQVKAQHACEHATAQRWTSARGVLGALANEASAQSGKHLTVAQAAVIGATAENAARALPGN